MGGVTHSSPSFWRCLACGWWGWVWAEGQQPRKVPRGTYPRGGTKRQRKEKLLGGGRRGGLEEPEGLRRDMGVAFQTSETGTCAGCLPETPARGLKSWELKEGASPSPGRAAFLSEDLSP